MLRKLVLAVAATVGLLGAGGWTSKAAAGPDISIGIGFGRPGYYPGYSYYPPTYGSPSYYPPVVYPRPAYYRHYHVLYRTCRGEPWRLYGTYRSHSYAHEIEDYLEALGYDARIEHHENR